MQSLARTVPRPIPRSVSDWFDEITLAIADARGREPFATITGQRITDANLFHLAPVVCLKFRGRKLVGRPAGRHLLRLVSASNEFLDPDGRSPVAPSLPLPR
jgi:hypothetical protein